MFLHETFRTGLVFPSWLKWVQIVVCYYRNLQKHKYLSGISMFLLSSNSGMLGWNLQKHKYLSGISMFLHETFRTGLIFPSWLKWVQIVVCYDQNLQKHKYLSGISMFLHKTFRTGLVFPSWLKWVQIVVCYNQNLQKHKYLSGISTFSEILSGISMFLKPSEQGSFFWAGWNESK